MASAEITGESDGRFTILMDLKLLRPIDALSVIVAGLFRSIRWRLLRRYRRA
jgi:hypothetical protein